MRSLGLIGNDLIQILRERRGDEPPPPAEAAPPPAPTRWTNDHLDFDTTAETVKVSIREPYSQGCEVCWRSDGWIIDRDTRTARRCEECLPLRRRAERYDRAALPSKFFGKAYDHKAVPVEILRVGDLWIDSLNDGGCDSLVLAGRPGTGKSFQAYQLARRVLSRRVGVRWIRWQSLLDDIRTTYSGKSGYSEREIWAEVLGTRGVVIIDDFGDGSGTDWAKGQATHMLDCMPSTLRCIITTNATPNGESGIHLDDVLGIRAASRIYGITAGGRFMVTVSGSDWRRKC